jgi:hypothetical protein
MLSIGALNGALLNQPHEHNTTTSSTVATMVAAITNHHKEKITNAFW